jgi:hypothetical protein
MNIILRALLIGLILAITSTVRAGSYEDGTAAYQKGDYATALQLWRSIAGQGRAGK